MKRSQINTIMREADSFIRERGFYLPPFAYWTPAEWSTKGGEVREIVENGLGWDITDFGTGEYTKSGLFLFTLRNGHPRNWETLEGKLYAEKISSQKPGEETRFFPKNLVSHLPHPGLLKRYPKRSWW